MSSNPSICGKKINNHGEREGAIEHHPKPSIPCVFIFLDLTFHHGKKKRNEEEEAAHKQVKKVHSIQFYDCNFSGPRKVNTKNKAKISIT